MGRTRGPCECKWCRREAIPRSGSVQVCAVCQDKVNRVARSAAELQEERGLTNHLVGASLGMEGESWARLRRIMRAHPGADLVTSRIDPRHPIYSTHEPAPPVKDAGAGWEHRAACRKVEDPDIFFPERTTDRKTVHAVIRDHCAKCPVTQECGRSRGSEGVWGGEYHRGRVG